MKKTWVITVGREFCSGGAETARLLAEKLNVPYYDRDLIDHAVAHTNLSLEQVMANEEKPDGKFSDPYGRKVYRDDPTLTLPVHARIYDAQCEAIRQMAGKGPCVIVGRCADYVLGECSRVVNVISVFIRADLDKRVARAMRLYGLTKEDAEKQILKTDKIRSKYYNAHTGREWRGVNNYSLIVDTGKFGTEGAASVIEAAVKELISEKDVEL